MVKESVTKALADASVQYKDVNQAVVGYVYGITNDLFTFSVTFVLFKCLAICY